VRSCDHGEYSPCATVRAGVATTLATLTLLPLLIGPPSLIVAEPPANEDPGITSEPESAAEPVPPPASAQKREWMLVIAPGFDYVIGPKANPYRALGGGFRFGGHAIKWAGAKGHFLVGGGPILHYSYIADKTSDKIHIVTVNGDLLLGGGKQRWGVYWHLTAGLGYLQASDGQTNTNIRTLGARAATGVGGYAKIVDRFSLGALVDVGWAGGTWVNALITANIHFGRRGDPL